MATADQCERIVERLPIAQRVQYRPQAVPGDPAIGTDFLHDLVEPDVCRLHALVQDFKTARAHFASPGICRQKVTNAFFCAVVAAPRRECGWQL
jgi:hypothetical protein